MFLESARHRKRHVAETAFVNIFAKSSVRFHVTSQFGALGAGIRAELALIGLLARMRAPVNSQVRTIFEHLATKFTGIVAAAGVLLAPLQGRARRVHPRRRRAVAVVVRMRVARGRGRAGVVVATPTRRARPRTARRRRQAGQRLVEGTAAIDDFAVSY